jgi:hypothetical protein
MFEEYEPVSDDDEDEGSPGDSVSTTDASDHHSFIMGYSSAKVDLRSLHPLPSQIPFYWETYKENVDPLCKVGPIICSDCILLILVRFCTYQR